MNEDYLFESESWRAPTWLRCELKHLKTDAGRRDVGEAFRAAIKAAGL